MLLDYANETLKQCQSWQYVCFGGETLTQKVLDSLRRLGLNLSLVDCYGPTEISCAATFRKISFQSSRDNIKTDIDGIYGESTSVGIPLPNTYIHVIGSNGEALPCGYQGEIYIGGCGVAKGYLDEPLSKSKFIEDPFAKDNLHVKNERHVLYKIGDKGCLSPDGSLLFLGRMDDDLVKLRGQRIELREVSKALIDASDGLIIDAVVTLRGEPEFLIAHVIFSRGLFATHQQDLLSKLPSLLTLPQYMIPSFIVPIDRLPLTPNGKIDKRAKAAIKLPQNTNFGHKIVSQPLTVPQGELRLLWKELLGDVTIEADTDFFSVGGSSLLLVRLQNLLRERMGVQIPLHELYEHSTLSRMAAKTNHERSMVEDVVIDWEEETTLPPDLTESHLLYSRFDLSSDVQRTSGTCLLLTGATTFLGSEILRVLIADENISEIHCVAVASEQKGKVQGLSDKITVYFGSLQSSTLSLTSKEQQWLQANIHAIIHAGSQGHCLNNYHSVKQSNYGSTQFLAKLALPSRIPIHFISSLRVILQSGSCTSSPRSMAEHLPDNDGSQGFTASKWANKRYLERIVQTQEKLEATQPLQVIIHRPCSLIGDRAPHDDAMNSVMRYSPLSHTVPTLPNAEGFFDFKDVVEVARDIAHDVASSASSTGPSPAKALTFRHLSSNVRTPFSEFGSRLEMMQGEKYTAVSMEEWLGTASELGIEELIVSYLRANMGGSAVLTFPYLGE